MGSGGRGDDTVVVIGLVPGGGRRGIRHDRGRMGRCAEALVGCSATACRLAAAAAPSAAAGPVRLPLDPCAALSSTEISLQAYLPPACSFAGGNFRDKVRSAAADAATAATLSEQITVRQDKDSQSHSAGFEVSSKRPAQGACCLHAAAHIVLPAPTHAGLAALPGASGGQGVHQRRCGGSVWGGQGQL